MGNLLFFIMADSHDRYNKNPNGLCQRSYRYIKQRIPTYMFIYQHNSNRKRVSVEFKTLATLSKDGKKRALISPSFKFTI